MPSIIMPAEIADWKLSK